MNGKDEIIKKRLYFEGLKQAIDMPLPEEAIRDVDEILQDDGTEAFFKETLRLWKEVCGPFDDALRTDLHCKELLRPWRLQKNAAFLPRV